MSKYWNPRRIKRVREREKRSQERIIAKSAEEFERRRTFTQGDIKKNTRLMLDALGIPLRRKMVARLAREGAMSLSKLAEPFRLTLPTAQFHLGILERAGIVITHKQGRVRMIVYNKTALKQLADTLSATTPSLS